MRSSWQWGSSLCAEETELPDIDRSAGRGISYFVKEKDVFAGKLVMIVGGGIAVDRALMFKDIAANSPSSTAATNFARNRESAPGAYGLAA